MVKQTSSSQQQTATRFESRQQESGPLITASNIFSAFTSSSTISKPTSRASRMVTGHVPKTPQQSVDLENLQQIPSPKEQERKSSLVSGTSNMNFRKIKTVNETTVTSQIKASSVTTSSESLVRKSVVVKPEFGVQIPHKSPLPERSLKLKEVPIPQVPTSAATASHASTAAVPTAKTSNTASGDVSTIFLYCPCLLPHRLGRGEYFT